MFNFSYSEKANLVYHRIHARKYGKNNEKIFSIGWKKLCLVAKTDNNKTSNTKYQKTQNNKKAIAK